MLNDRTRRRRRHWLAAGLAIAVVGILGATAVVWLLARAPSASPRAARRTLPARTRHERRVSPPTTTAATTSKRKQMPRPVRISIPAIGVSAPVVPLGLNPDGTLEVPTVFSQTGWFTQGPEPGETGAAVIVGHLESLSGPGVFHRLRDLRVGAVISIRLRDRSMVRYVVDSMLRVSKSRFPTNRVYAQTKKPTLRLITCAGTMNPTTGHHPDNYIVFASILA